MTAPRPATVLGVTMVVSLGPRQVIELTLALPPRARLADAIAHCQGLPAFANVPLAAMAIGIWGRKAPAHKLLHEGDRIELYRPLQVDPKLARRERFARQGARSAGLFARRRAGGKAGY